MRTKLFSLALFAIPLFLTGCWTGTCDEEPLMCDMCGPSGCYDENCDPAFCRVDGDCAMMEYCNTSWNQCFPEDIECYYDWECPEGSICSYNSDYGLNVCTNPNPDNVCTSDWDCPENSYCNEFSGRCEESVECVTSAECADGFYCDYRNVCSPRPTGSCTNDAQCGQGAYCDDGTCVNSSLCITSADCTDPAAPICDDRGVCVVDSNPPVPCSDNAGCDTGKICVDGQCEDETPRDPSLNCLINEHCGEFGRCVDGKCYTACVDSTDCGTGQFCGTDGYCEEDPAAGTECVANTDCVDTSDICVDGLCHDFCTDSADCTNAHDRCLEGVCVPNDVVNPQCFTNNDCMGGEECFEGVCRVPCQDNDDCAGCPGNPICGTGGYCMDTNDISPECTLSADCTGGNICVDAMCVVP
ncbi:hypothetical protein KKF84_18935 [Myxococcota bacterium]|nr:hypothetical protein [Myxococcota bacterium]MBU1537399.1 hypothetical protein [Myxococcota bacterium]